MYAQLVYDRHGVEGEVDQGGRYWPKTIHDEDWI